MGNRDKKIVLLDGLAEHPAFLAWKHIYTASVPPTSIELLKGERSKTPVYRLRGVTGADGPVIAKRLYVGERGADSGLPAEARIYTDVLQAFSIPAVECYGHLEEFNGYWWLFLEDAGDVRYSPKDPANCSLAIRWMAHLHSTPTKVVSTLLDTGPTYFRSVLRETRQGVRSSLAHPAIKNSSIAAFEAILDHLDVIENAWAQVEQACSGIPQTLVHGDFVPKNVRVRGAGDDAQILVIDWETAGAAPPAADIAMIPQGRTGRRAYFETLREAWPSLAWEDVERLYRIGQLFRLLHAVEWQSRSFKYDWIERAQRHMLEHQRALHDLVQDGLWLHG